MRPTAAIILAAALAVLPPPAARAQSSTEEDLRFFAEEAQVLTVASPVPESVFNSGSNVTVIDRAAIERYNYSSVSEALQSLAGVTVTRTYLLHRLPTMRGALQEHYADKVLVMVDNVPMWHAVTGEGNLDRVGIESVERIEVLRGPASVLYGSNALSGAVNIVLRKPKGKGEAAGRAGGGLGVVRGMYAGAADASNANASYAANGEAFDYLFAADFRNDRQPAYLFEDEAGTALRVPEYYKTRSFTFKGGRGGSRLLVNAARSEEVSLGNSLTQASGGLFPELREAAVGSYSYELTPAWGGLKYALTYDWQRRNLPRDGTDNLRSEIVGSRLVNSLVGHVELPRGVRLEFGGDHDYREALRYQNYLSRTGAAQSDNGMDNRLDWEGAAFLQAALDLEAWRFIAGTRFTHDHRIADNVSSRLSAVRLFGAYGSLKAMFSQSFRSPTPFERFFIPAPVTVLGNPALRPERAETFELSYLAAVGPVSSHLTAYYTTYKDTIYRAVGAFSRDGTAYNNVNFYENAPTYNSKGLEAALRYETPRSHAFLSGSVLKGSRGDERSIPAPGAFGLPGGTSWNFKYVPAWAGAAGGGLELGDFSCSSTVNLLGETGTLRGRIGAQAWGDAGVGYAHGAVRHALAVRNLTDARVLVPEYVRQRVVESLPLYTGRRFEYSFSVRF